MFAMKTKKVNEGNHDVALLQDLGVSDGVAFGVQDQLQRTDENTRKVKGKFLLRKLMFAMKKGERGGFMITKSEQKWLSDNKVMSLNCF